MEMELENDNTNKKDLAKEKIILFVIGVLVGAVISTAAFFVYIKVAGIGNTSSNSSQQMSGGTPPEMPNGENGQGGTPPEMPSGDNSQSGQNGQGGTPPEKPSDNNNSKSNS